MRMIILTVLLLVVAGPLGGCAILAGAVIGGAIEHEWQNGEQGVYGMRPPHRTHHSPSHRGRMMTPW